MTITHTHAVAASETSGIFGAPGMGIDLEVEVLS